MDAEMNFIPPIEDAPDYVLTVGERWECPCGGGFWQQIDHASAGCSAWVWCPFCNASAAWFTAPDSGSNLHRAP